MHAGAFGLKCSELDALLYRQDGVLTRQQLRDVGVGVAAIKRILRRRELVKVYPGVYVNHTGPLTPRQRAWSAVLDAAPAVLSHESALNPGRSGTVHVAVDRSRRVRRRVGVVVHYRVDLAATALWHTSPPRVSAEDAVLDIASDAKTEASAFGALADAVGGRRTTVRRLLAVLNGRPKLRRHGFIRDALVDLAAGTCSLLERRYLRDVERAHGLPRPARQPATTVGRAGFRDVDYPDWRTVVELDGRPGHDDAASRDRDMERDLDAAVGANRLTLRLGRAQVFDRPCATAAKVAAVLRQRGWPGEFRRCPSCPPSPP